MADYKSSILIFVLLILIACGKETDTPDQTLSEASAHEIIAAWIVSDYNTEMNPAVSFSVEEIEVDGALESLGGQVFKIKSDVPSLNNRTVFLKDKKISDLSIYVSLGAEKPKNLLVIDLNHDNLHELFYTINHGSGILRTDLFCYLPEPFDTVLTTPHGFLISIDDQIRFRTLNSDNLQIVLKSKLREIILGELYLHASLDSQYLEVMQEPNISVETIDRTTGTY